MKTKMEAGCFNDSSHRMPRSNSVTTNQVECRNQPMPSCKEASFIKIVDLGFSKQLKIPEKFGNIFNGNVPHRFIIENAMTKNCWRVEVKEEANVIYLREGWADFVEANPLEVGDVVLFEYEEQSIFVVKIYDRNGCQKMARDVEGGKNEPEKKIEFEEREESEDLQQDLQHEPKELGTRRSCQEYTKRVLTRKYGNGIYKKQHAIPSKPVKTVSVSTTNMAFSVKMHKYLKHQFKQQFIPKAIILAQKLMSKNEVIFEDALGIRWPVKISHISDGRAIFTHGWKAFLEGNDVAAGDSLTFEFVSEDLVKARVTKDPKVKLAVENEHNSQNGATIVPNMDDGLDDLDAFTDDVNPAGTPTTTRRGTKRDSPETSSSSFSFLWRSNTDGSFLHIPKIVAVGQNLMKKDAIVLRDPSGKCWTVEISKRQDGRVALTKGWVDFWIEQRIKVGDSLHFEFVSRYVVQVEINRGKPLTSPTKTEETIINFNEIDNDEPPVEPDLIWPESITGLPDANDFL